MAKAKAKVKTAPVKPTAPNSFMRTIKVRLTFTEELLGTASASKEVQKEHVAKHAPDARTLAEEIEAASIDEVVDSMMTIFPRKGGIPINWDYQIKGYMKSCASYLARTKNAYTVNLVAYRKVIAGNVFVSPRAIPLILPEGGAIGNLQRPLRAETAQGPRIALANSETLPAGTTMEFKIEFPDLKANVDLETCIREWLDFGVYHGHGQWRNAGYGRFTWEELTD